MGSQRQAYMVECADICCTFECIAAATHAVYDKRNVVVGRFCLEHAESFVDQLNAPKGESNG